MKRFLLWSFERGSLQYDVLCGIILAFIFLTPKSAFRDRPGFMRISTPEKVRASADKNGNPVYTVQLDETVFLDRESFRQEAQRALEASVGRPVNVSRMQPIFGLSGRLMAYAVWVDR